MELKYIKTIADVMYFYVNYKLIMFLNITTYSIVYFVLFFLEKKLSSKGLFFSELSAFLR